MKKQASRSSPRRVAEVFVVSDGTGDTASNAARAALLQFATPWRMRTFGGVRQESVVRRVVEHAARDGAIILFTIVHERVVRALRERSDELGVPTVDLLGPLIARFAEHVKAEPRLTPGLLHGFSDEYFRRIEAVEFAVRHDDGANLRTLFQADIVLTGVSRTSKTPLSMYLAQRGYKTGNVPLIPGMEPPRELLELSPQKVFGLLADVETLLTVRRARIQALRGAPFRSYVSPEAIYAELQRARRLFAERGWRVVNVAGRAVEENASRIVALVEQGAEAQSGR